MNQRRPRINKANRVAIEQATDPIGMSNRLEFSGEMAKKRHEGITSWYTQGGEYGLKWVKENHRRWTGEPLRWNEVFLEEFVILFFNPWIERETVQKSAQIGYSEICIAFCAFCLAHAKVSTGFVVEQASKLRDLVGPRFQPSFDYNQVINEIRKERLDQTKREDTDTKDRTITIGGIPLTFAYVSTASSKKQSGERQATSSVSSFEGWVILADEIELYPGGALDILVQRQNACTMPTKPFRAGSTPGQEGGIVDVEIKLSRYKFEWQIECPACGKKQFLHPFGNLLKGVWDDDDKVTRYVSVSGRPLKWFCYDDSSRSAQVDTAYIGCQHCEKELDRETLDSGHFVCANTGVNALEFSRSITAKRQPVYDKVAIILPKIASYQFNATKQIQRLLTSRNPSDELQQGLGVAVSIGAGKVEPKRLLQCVEYPYPDDLDTRYTHSLICMGVDQGRAYNYGVIAKYYFPEGETWEDRWYNAFVDVLWYGELAWGSPAGFVAVEKVALDYEVDWLGMDVDPEYHLASNFAKTRLPYKVDKVQVLCCDQVELKGKNFHRRQGPNDKSHKQSRKQRKRDPSIQLLPPLYSVHRTFGLDAVRDRVYSHNLRLPAGTEYNPGMEGNFLYHYTTSDRLPEGRWKEPAGEPDHYFHAHNFMSLAALLSGYEPNPYRKKFSFTSLPMGY